eukprot:gnl/TRDRNA2_/TRDRNA2_174096_c1_seq20.p1 gnl/TRDRNA2_/TRDRNA2_174096_c1~~gnl/TRDRNA2_/TRDRNA2_174096_c1_seq20.p1  ORF type:complete len:262 (-),score=55.13 gnl/TRDRNA2_/TRDRNA2_174096_c1_seq20:68-853(-)
MFRLVACVAVLAAVHASQTNGALRQSSRAEGFVRSLEFKHRLRVCNAYPYNAALDVYRGKSEKLTSDGAMPYKSCQDFSTPLKAGDKLEFKVGDASAGTFSVSDLPNNDAVLMLVIHRHDTLSTAVSFESHVFANLLNAQIAIIDTYKGRARAVPRIMDEKAAKNARSEELRYDSVVAVKPGTYDVALVGEDGANKAKAQLVALNRESYVVMRVGVEAQQGPAYPQELVVYPKSEEPKKSGAATRMMVFPLLLAAVASLMQ